MYIVGAAASGRQLISCALSTYFRESSNTMSTTAYPSQEGRAKPPDPGGGQGWRRRDANNTPQPGVYPANREIFPTWAGIAAGAAKKYQEETGGKLTQTICVQLTRDSNTVNYNLDGYDVEHLIFDCIGLKNQEDLKWVDNSFFRTIIFGISEDVDTKQLALGISHSIRRGLKSKAVKPAASEINLKIFWTQYGADTAEITEALSKFGTVLGEYSNQVFPPFRKDGRPSRLANVQKGDLAVKFKPERALPTYILVKNKKIKVHFDGQTNTCPRCFRFPAVGMGGEGAEACYGKGDATECRKQDPKGPDHKYIFEEEWKKLVETKNVKGSVEDNLIGGSGFNMEDVVEITNLPEAVEIKDVKDWIQGFGLRMSEVPDDKFQFDNNFQNKIRISGLDTELAEKIQENCWGKSMGEGKKAKKVFVDLVRTSIRKVNEDVKDGDEFEDAAEELPIDMDNVDHEDLISEDEDEMEGTPSLEEVCKDEGEVEQLVMDSMEKRNELLSMEIKKWKKPEGGLVRDDLKTMLNEKQLTAASVDEVCREKGIDPGQAVRQKLHNLVRRRGREEITKRKAENNLKRSRAELATSAGKQSPPDKMKKTEDPDPNTPQRPIHKDMLKLLNKSHSKERSRSKEKQV